MGYAALPNAARNKIPSTPTPLISNHSQGQEQNPRSIGLPLKSTSATLSMLSDKPKENAGSLASANPADNNLRLAI
jgi:hypothetical protein